MPGPGPRLWEAVWAGHDLPYLLPVWEGPLPHIPLGGTASLENCTFSPQGIDLVQEGQQVAR
jgi:hypothetical protein